MILSDMDLRRSIVMGALTVTPLEDRDIQPASIDLHLGDTFRVRPPLTAAEEMFGAYVDPTDPPLDDWVTTVVEPHAQWALPPGGFALASTVETVGLDKTLAAQVQGKSTLARHGLMVHTTAGWVDPGFRGHITLELVNVTERHIVLTPGMAIAQIVVQQLMGPCRLEYGHKRRSSHYQGQQGPTVPQAVGR